MLWILSILSTGSEARIRVRKNLCDFLPATIELKNESRGNFFLNFGDNESIDNPDIAIKGIFLVTFLILSIFVDYNQLLDEDVKISIPSSNWDFIKQNKPSI